MRDLVAECLSLRRWAFRLLARLESVEDSIAAIPRVSLDAWTLFLAAETFSRFLAARLGASAALLPAAAREVLERGAREEVQRVMAARAQLRAMDDIAERCGVDPIVLKGGVHAVDGGEAFDLSDVDLLLDTPGTAILGQALVEEGGYSFEKRSAQHKLEGGITVELHDGLEVGYGIDVAGGTESQPLRGFRRLRRLAPVAHVVYCIQHTTTKHSLRRGHLRDLLLIADALEDCSVAELDGVREALSRSPERDVYLTTFALARSMQARPSGGAPVSDPFARVAAGKYATSLWLPNGSPGFPLHIDHALHFVASWGGAGRLINGYLRTPVQRESRWNSTLVSRVSPRLAVVLGAIARTPYRVVALGYAFLVGMLIRANYRVRWRSASERPY
jgi:hypothetical protein